VKVEDMPSESPAFQSFITLGYILLPLFLLSLFNFDCLGAVELSSLFLQQFVGYLYKAELV